jgi:hypothetical protein
MRLSPAIPASARFCKPKEVGRELRISVRRHRNASGTRNGRGTQPAGHTANAGQIGHNVFSGGVLKRLVQRALTIKVRAKLQRRQLRAGS